MPEYSVFMTPLSKLYRAYKIANDEDAEDDATWRAAWYMVEALATSGLAPVPVTGMRKTASLFMSEEE